MLWMYFCCYLNYLAYNLRHTACISSAVFRVLASCLHAKSDCNHTFNLLKNLTKISQHTLSLKSIHRERSCWMRADKRDEHNTRSSQILHWRLKWRHTVSNQYPFLVHLNVPDIVTAKVTVTLFTHASDLSKWPDIDVPGLPSSTTSRHVTVTVTLTVTVFTFSPA